MNSKKQWLQTLGSVKLGIIFLLLIALAVVVGTVIVQKPLAEPGQIEKLYSPSKLKVYEALGLFDLFHTWWFTALLALMMLNLTAASALRFPVVWREVRRRRDPDETLMRAMSPNAELRVPLERVSAALREHHYHVRAKQLPDGRPGLTAEKQRYARLAPYFVHFSLLLILLGGIIDSRLGFRAFMRLNEGEQKAVAYRLVSDTPVQLPYAIRCEDAGMEQYPDGSPKRYWSKLAVLEGGREVKRKEIEVNSPLVYRGVRFFQSSYGESGKLESVHLAITPKSEAEVKAAAGGESGGPPHGDLGNPETAAQESARVIELAAGRETEVPEYGLRLSIAAFYPDFYMDGGQMATRSEEPNNPALKLAVTRNGDTIPVWVFANYPQFTNTQKLPIRINLRDLHLGKFTGLQVTSQPGQWLVWLGSTVLAFGFVWAFFFAHRQFWAIESVAADGRPVVLLAGMTSKLHEEFRDEFQQLSESLKEN